MPAVHLPKKPWVSDTITERGNPTIRQKKQILVTDANDKSKKRTVETEAGVVRFEHGTAVLPNDARGRDIAAEVREKALDPHGVAVVKDREGFYRDPVHRSFWGSMPEMPWKRDNGTEDNRRETPPLENALLEDGEGEPE